MSDGPPRHRGPAWAEGEVMGDGLGLDTWWDETRPTKPPAGSLSTKWGRDPALLVIFGAGASYDSCAVYPPHGVDRPPGTKVTSILSSSQVDGVRRSVTISSNPRICSATRARVSGPG